MAYARLRAIETRRSIARSANTGISAFINQRGDVTQELGYWEPGGLYQILNANSKLTLYTVFGDYIARISSFVTAVLLLYTIARVLIRRKRP
jgi:apolipoprotein N-acyltransferase